MGETSLTERIGAATGITHYVTHHALPALMAANVLPDEVPGLDYFNAAFDYGIDLASHGVGKGLELSYELHSWTHGHEHMHEMPHDFIHGASHGIVEAGIFGATAYFTYKEGQRATHWLDDKVASIRDDLGLTRPIDYRRGRREKLLEQLGVYDSR